MCCFFCFCYFWDRWFCNLLLWLWFICWWWGCFIGYLGCVVFLVILIWGIVDICVSCKRKLWKVVGVFCVGCWCWGLFRFWLLVCWVCVCVWCSWNMLRNFGCCWMVIWLRFVCCCLCVGWFLIVMVWLLWVMNRIIVWCWFVLMWVMCWWLLFGCVRLFWWVIGRFWIWWLRFGVVVLLCLLWWLIGWYGRSFFWLCWMCLFCLVLFWNWVCCVVICVWVIFYMCWVMLGWCWIMICLRLIILILCCVCLSFSWVRLVWRCGWRFCCVVRLEIVGLRWIV